MPEAGWTNKISAVKLKVRFLLQTQHEEIFLPTTFWDYPNVLNNTLKMFANFQDCLWISWNGIFIKTAQKVGMPEFAK